MVVLDGGSGRFAAADRIGHGLLQPTPELLQGFDTATQITALAHWLRHQPSPRIAQADLPTPSPSEHRKLLRDARCPERVVGRRLICSGQRGS